ncbi:MAG: EAL domain-containing protein [Spirochaetaceae bacterium]|jgi:diguanylate cyclase (GGDEF)-like protein/PAS domain S-box-containing protein|nr:EAL domain-containing protein [Spirochaetaceae bacterium]
MKEKAAKRFRLALISPFLCGNYLGSLVNNVRRLSLKLDFDLLTMQTRNFNEFSIPLALNNIDGIIVIIDAISHQLAQKIIDKNIPIISIGTDYSPLNIDFVQIDNKDGIFQAMDHLVEIGHRDIGFSGDISISDIRLRYEAYLQYLTEHNMERNSSRIFITNDTFFKGGIETAEGFLKRQNPCSAILFSTDLNAIGFQERIQSEGIKIPEDVAIVGFDNIFLNRLKHPQLTSIDQNLDNISNYAVQRILKKIKSKEPLKIKSKIVPCRLVIRGSTSEKKASEPQVYEKKEKYLRADFEEGMLANNYEAVKSIILGHSGAIESLTPLFGPFMHLGCYANWNNPEKPDQLEIDRVFGASKIIEKNILKKGAIYDQSEFPPVDLFNLFTDKNHLLTMLPISIDGIKWGVFVMAGSSEEIESYSSYSMFTNYMDLLSFNLEKETLINEVVVREKKTKCLSEELEIVSQNATDGIWIWDLDSNRMEWNVRAINMLGFINEEEIKSQKHIPFYTRIHPEDVVKVKEKIHSHLERGVPLRAEFRMKTRDNEYIWIDTSGEAVLDKNGTPLRIIGSVSDVSERHRHQEKIKYMAFYDALTGLPNRAMIGEQLQSHIYNKQSEKLAVMLLDLDRFKFINDSYGHDAGDRLLKYVSRKVSTLLREQDFFARFGGDEFVFICPIENISKSKMIGERVLEELREPYKDEMGFDFFITGSMGIAIYPKDGTNSDELIRNADISMYKAKQSGKNQLKLFEKNMNETIQGRVSMENLLRKAEKNKEFQLFIQPQYQIDSNKLIGGEVLMRWYSAEAGWIPPSEFIPMAEETGLIIPMGTWLINEACNLIKQWQNQYGTSITLSINISAEQILKRKLLPDLENALEISQLAPESLCVEITESTAISDFEHTKKILHTLKDMGVQISLDDFGTGYSSLSLLKELPLNELKIDKSFLPGSKTKKVDWIIIKSIITMGHALGFRIVIEGVETKEQSDYLKQMGCDIAQGFYFGKPQPTIDFEKLLKIG